jgi:hypothetical protein
MNTGDMVDFGQRRFTTFQICEAGRIQYFDDGAYSIRSFRMARSGIVIHGTLMGKYYRHKRHSS